MMTGRVSGITGAGSVGYMPVTGRKAKVWREERPWVPVEKDYVFDTGDGQKTLRELFGGRSQLLVYHFMFGPDWAEGCPACSFWADSFDRAIVHLSHRDVTMLCASRAALPRLDACKRRMGWSFRWVSSLRTEFKYDFDVSFPGDRRNGAVHNFRKQERLGEEHAGLSAFALADGVLYHLFVLYARPGNFQQRLPATRPRPARPRRGRAIAAARLAAPPRPVRRQRRGHQMTLRGMPDQKMVSESAGVASTVPYDIRTDVPAGEQRRPASACSSQRCTGDTRGQPSPELDDPLVDAADAGALRSGGPLRLGVTRGYQPWTG